MILNQILPRIAEIQRVPVPELLTQALSHHMISLNIVNSTFKKNIVEQRIVNPSQRNLLQQRKKRVKSHIQCAIRKALDQPLTSPWKPSTQTNLARARPVAQPMNR